MTHVDYYRCDRCQEEYNYEDHGATVRDHRKQRDYDLCKNCLFLLRGWLRPTKGPG